MRLSQYYEHLGRLFADDNALFREGPALIAEMAGHPDLHRLLLQPVLEPQRIRVMGEPGGPVVRLLHLPENTHIPPHEHGKKRHLDFVVSGRVAVTDWTAQSAAGGLYRLEEHALHLLHPGGYVTVDPEKTEIHSLWSQVPSRVLMVAATDLPRTAQYHSAGDEHYRRRMAALPDHYSPFAPKLHSAVPTP